MFLQKDLLLALTTTKKIIDCPRGVCEAHNVAFQGKSFVPTDIEMAEKRIWITKLTEKKQRKMTSRKFSS